jgi:hypothetical protein
MVVHDIRHPSDCVRDYCEVVVKDEPMVDFSFPILVPDRDADSPSGSRTVHVCATFPA